MLHQLRDRQVWWNRDEHMHVIFGQDALLDMHAKFVTGLADDITDAFAHRTTPNL